MSQMRKAHASKAGDEAGGFCATQKTERESMMGSVLKGISDVLNKGMDALWDYVSNSKNRSNPFEVDSVISFEGNEESDEGWEGPFANLDKPLDFSHLKRDDRKGRKGE